MSTAHDVKEFIFQVQKELWDSWNIAEYKISSYKCTNKIAQEHGVDVRLIPGVLWQILLYFESPHLGPLDFQFRLC